MREVFTVLLAGQITKSIPDMNDSFAQFADGPEDRDGTTPLTEYRNSPGEDFGGAATSSLILCLARAGTTGRAVQDEGPAQSGPHVLVKG
jgi:hypothetical protein